VLMPNSDPEEEKREDEELKTRFQPLIDWLKTEAKDVVRDGEQLR
jgi:heat shock protein beta